jgi:hypothetical protein
LIFGKKLHTIVQVGKTRVSHKVSLPMRFIGGEVGKFDKSIMLVRFSSLPHGLELLEDNVHD